MAVVAKSGGGRNNQQQNKVTKMKTIITLLASAVVAVALFTLPASAAGLSDGPYTAYSQAFHGPNGGLTNHTTGYTNAVSYNRVVGSSAAFEVAVVGSANHSNNMTLIVWPVMVSGTIPDSGATRIAFRCTNAVTGGFSNRFITNVTVVTPWVGVQLENPLQNVGGVTNPVIRYTSKTP